ncbi:MAG: transcriptional repressor [Planctomycetota bacterium]|jgi:Fe2+ or Zn2+ uptake regulation protein|nr:transcriptional repressor [Planctomycetota bacterium]
MKPENDIFRDICRKNNWKCTIQRRLIYEYLIANRCHPNAETVRAHLKTILPDVSLDSVYRILADFCAAGIVKRLDSGPSYRYDINTVPHDHFVCQDCGRLHDIDVVEESSLANHCTSLGRVLNYELEVRGICHSCLDSHKPSDLSTRRDPLTSPEDFPDVVLDSAGAAY